MRRASALFITLFLAACDQPDFDWEELSTGEQAVLACHAAFRAADYWHQHGVSVACTPAPDVAVQTKAGPGTAYFRFHPEDVLSRPCRIPVQTIAGYAVRPDFAVFTQSTTGMTDDHAFCWLSWVAAHELGHVLGYQHDQSELMNKSLITRIQRDCSWPPPHHESTQ